MSKVIQGISLCVCWSIIGLCLIALGLSLFNYYSYSFACWDGSCTELGTIQYDYSDDDDENPKIIPIKDVIYSDEYAKYYLLYVDASSASSGIKLSTINITESLCVAYSPNVKPSTCNYHYSTADGPTIYSDSVSLIIGVFNRYNDEAVDIDIAFEIVGYGQSLDFTPFFIWVAIIGGTMMFLMVCILPACVFTCAFGLSFRKSHYFQPSDNPTEIELENAEYPGNGKTEY